MAGKTVVEQLIIEIAGDSKKYLKAVKDVKRANKDFVKVGLVASLSIGTAATTLGVTATNAFKKFETGVTNVAKTTNLAGQELDDFKQEIMDMSERIPVTTDRLLEIATAAGQLGIKGTKNLSKFTEVIAKLGATTNVSGEEAAISLARILNLTNENIDSAENFASALVALGNDLELNEAELLEMATQLAKSTVQFKLSSAEVLGLAGAMASLGIQAEAGSTVVMKAFSQIENIIRKQGGPAFERLTELTELTGEELTKTFGENKLEVFRKFIGGLQKAEQSGKFLKDELNNLGLAGTRIEKILPTLALNFDTVTKSVDLSTTSYKENIALSDESTKAFGTNANKIIKAQNKLNNLFIEVGEKITPELVKAIEEIVGAIKESQPVIAGLAKSFSFVVTNSIKLIGALQQTAREIRALVSWDEALISSMDKTAEQEKHLSEMLKARGITLEQFRKKQAEFSEQRKKSAEQAVKDAEKEADAQAERTASFLSSFSSYKDFEKKKTDILKKQTKKRKTIQETAADEAIEKQLEADAKMFEEIEEFSENVVWEYQERQKEILKDDEEAEQELLDQQLEADDRMFDELEQHTDDVVFEYEKRQREIAREEERALSKNEKLYRKHHGKLLTEEGKFGVAMLAVKEAQSSAEYGAMQLATSQLSSLIDSENNELKEIGKAATIIQIGMSTVESAMKAFNSLAWIPYVGWALGGIAAAAIGAYGLEQINTVRGMKEGGVVPGVGTGDKVPTLLEPGELVVPRDITKEILSGYGARKMAAGGKVDGDQEKTDLHKTFADIFKVPAIFKALLAGDEMESNVGGFGADSFNGMVPRMMDALKESAYEQGRAVSQHLPLGELIHEISRAMNIPIEKMQDILQDNAVTQWIADNLDSDVAAVLTGGGPIQDALDDAINNIIDDVNRHVMKIFGFQKGGVPGFVEPGEMRLSKNALSAIAGGINMSQNISSVSSRPSVQRSSATNQGGVQKQIVGVEISLNDNAAEVINAQIREGNQLGTMKPA